MQGQGQGLEVTKGPANSAGGGGHAISNSSSNGPEGGADADDVDMT